jgi:hypothetical protein
MTISVVLFYVRLLLSVALGLWLGLKINPAVRKGVTRMTPMRQRLNEHFLRRLGLWAGGLTIALAGGIAMLLFWGLGALGMGAVLPNKGGQPAKTRLEKVLKTSATPAVDTERMLAIVPQPEPSPVLAQGDCYLQVGAFDQLGNAEQCAQNWRSRVNLAVIIGRANSGPGIYKVLIGPFASFEAVKNFRVQQGIPGFSRKGAGIQPLN